MFDVLRETIYRHDLEYVQRVCVKCGEYLFCPAPGKIKGLNVFEAIMDCHWSIPVLLLVTARGR